MDHHPRDPRYDPTQERVPAWAWVVLLVGMVVATAIEAFPWPWVVALIAWFGVWEWIAVSNRIPGDTFTEFQRHRIPHPILRFAVASWAAVIIYLRLPEPWNQHILVPFAAWYIPHLIFPGIELLVWRKIKGWVS